VEFYGLRVAISRSTRRLLNSLRNHGLRGTFERAFVKAPVAPPPPGAIIALRPHPFDLLHGTETGGFISGGDRAAVSLSACYTTVYLGIAPSALRAALTALPLEHRGFTFVDIGCGKGRALLVAAEFPFQQLVGLEIVPEFCEIARANVALIPEREKRISIVNEDAATFTYPEGPLILFLYFPFLTPVFRRVLANLDRQLRRSPRPAYLLYTNIFHTDADARSDGTYAEVIESSPTLKKLSDALYPLSEEEAAADPCGSVNHFVLYSVDPSL